MQPRLIEILEPCHKYNAPDLARRVFELDPSSAYDMLVVADNSASGTALIGRTEEEEARYDRARRELLPQMLAALCRMP